MLGPELEPISPTEVRFQGETYLFFGGNDYHRFSRHPQVIRALSEAALRYGINPAGSRATTANHPLYTRLEAKVADFLGAEAAVVCSAGYLSSALLLPACVQAATRLFLDERAHPCLAEAAETTGNPICRFRHADPDDLKAQLAASLRAGERPMILTDGVFANTGAIPPLAAYREVGAEYDAEIVVDDSHGVGVVGATGKGSWEERGLPREAVYQTGTLSKGLGGFGGFVTGSAALVETIRARSRAFIGSTPMPLPVAAAALQSLALLQSEPEKIALLQARAWRWKPAFRALGFAISEGVAPILSITYGDEAKNRALANHLRARGLYPSFIHYPGGPPGGHFRFTLSSAHTDAQLEHLYTAVADHAANNFG
jgi:glycine C-acetyltransferase/8-amino-7-oxononanoate synthase